MPIDPSLHAWAVTRGGVFTYREARERGIGDTELRRWLRAGEVVTPRRGAYVLGDAWAAARDAARLALRTKAVLATRPDSVASHQSAGPPLGCAGRAGAARPCTP